MTREETEKIIKKIGNTYTNYRVTSLSKVVDSWYDILKEYDYEVVLCGLKAFIITDTNGFPPQIGQILGKARQILAPKQLTSAEAWAVVEKSISSSRYIEEEFDKLPTAIQKAVGMPCQLRNWGKVDVAARETIIRPKFMEDYEHGIEREEEIKMLPNSIKAIIKEINKNADSAENYNTKQDRMIKKLENSEIKEPISEYIKNKYTKLK